MDCKGPGRDSMGTQAVSAAAECFPERATLSSHNTDIESTVDTFVSKTTWEIGMYGL